MKAIFITALLLVATAVRAGFGGMGAADDGNGGAVTLGAIAVVVVFFGGLVWFLSRFENDQQGFAWLVGGVILLLVLGGMSKCSG